MVGHTLYAHIRTYGIVHLKLVKFIARRLYYRQLVFKAKTAIEQEKIIISPELDTLLVHSILMNKMLLTLCCVDLAESKVSCAYSSSCDRNTGSGEKRPGFRSTSHRLPPEGYVVCQLGAFKCPCFKRPTLAWLLSNPLQKHSP